MYRRQPKKAEVNLFTPLDLGSGVRIIFLSFNMKESKKPLSKAWGDLLSPSPYTRDY